MTKTKTKLYHKKRKLNESSEIPPKRKKKERKCSQTHDHRENKKISKLSKKHLKPCPFEKFNSLEATALVNWFKKSGLILTTKQFAVSIIRRFYYIISTIVFRIVNYVLLQFSNE